jgi:anthranilate phosphoribosyltransferase
LGTPTIFNILGPLANPASAPFQLLGVGRANLQPLMAEALLLLGVRRALVVRGSDGLDEVTLGGATDVIELSEQNLRHLKWHPADLGLEPAGSETMVVSGPAESAEIIRAILSGKSGPPRDIVVANAAAALWTAGWSSSLTDCGQRAKEAIDTGAAKKLLAHLIDYTHARAR